MTELRRPSPFSADRPVPPGGSVGGQRNTKRAIRELMGQMASGGGGGLVLVGAGQSGKSTLLNFGRHVAAQASVLVAESGLTAGCFDLESDVATALVMSVVVALEASGAFADHADRRRIWLGQCARAPVVLDGAPPLLTPSQRASFYPEALLRDFNLLADHARSAGFSGFVVCVDDANELDPDVLTVLESLAANAQRADHWAILAASAQPLAGFASVSELGPLTPADIFELGGTAGARASRVSSQPVLSRADAEAVAVTTAGRPSEVAFCLDRMWVGTQTGDHRMQLSREILRALLERRDAQDAQTTWQLLDAIDGLSPETVLGLSFFSAFEALTEAQLQRLFALTSRMTTVSTGANSVVASLPPVSDLVDTLDDPRLLQRHEGRFTALGGDPFARQYLRSTALHHDLPDIPAQVGTYAGVAAFNISMAIPSALGPGARQIAGRALQFQSVESDVEGVQALATEGAGGIEDILRLPIRSLDSSFGIEDRGKPAVVVAARLRSCLDDGLFIADEELELIAVVQTEDKVIGVAGVIEDWLQEQAQGLAEARLQITRVATLGFDGATADALRVLLAPASALRTLFGAFMNREYELAAEYTAGVIELAQKGDSRNPRFRPLKSSLSDLRSRLVFLWAIVGQHDSAANLADELCETATHEDWLARYNRALLTGVRGGWVRAAEDLADLGSPWHGHDAKVVYLLLHCPGMALAPARPASHYFATVQVELLDEVVGAQRKSFEALTGRYENGEYLAHLHGLTAPAARRLAAWTAATKYDDVPLARDLLAQLIDADPESAAVYEADLEELGSSS